MRFPAHAAIVDEAFHETTPRRPSRPGPRPHRSHIDRNLLFGILALQNNFIDRDGLLAAFNSWVVNKSRSLSQILLERGVLTPSRHMLMEGLVEEHIKVHDNDVQKSLASLSSIGELREDLSRIAGSDLEASLHQVGAPRDKEAADRAAFGPSWRFAGPSGTQRAPENDPPGEVDSTIVGDSTSAGTRFRILRPHAKGGLGEVFVARDTELQSRCGRQGNPVAVRLRPALSCPVRVRGRDHGRPGTSGDRAGLRAGTLARRPAVLCDAIHPGGKPEGRDPTVSRGRAAAGPRPGPEHAGFA